ncbi:MAG TPA: HEAT repeat domain-containing protein [Polyangiales bacterium]
MSDQPRHSVPGAHAAKAEGAPETSSSPGPRSPGAAHLGRSAWLLGAVAGAWIALADYGAVWLWLPLWRDRAGLLWRSVGLLAPSFGLTAGVLWLLGSASYGWLAQRDPQRAPRRFALLWALLAAPALRVLALKLCSGGMMSRLRWRSSIELGLSLLLPALVYLALRLAQGVLTRLRTGRVGARVCGLTLLGAAFAAGKINQSVLPNLYDYLHSGLAVATWLSAWLGFGVLWSYEPRAAALRARLLRSGPQLAIAGSLLVLLTLSLLTLDSNLNVRVALFDPRAAVSRALLSAAAPLLRPLEQRSRPRIKTVPDAPASADTAGLPVHSGAHVLLVTVDALRADHLGAYGYERPVSPGLDALARSHQMFRRAYAQAPHSSYSLSSLHTSEYVHEVVELGRPVPTATLASVLRERGYHTAAFFTDGVFHTEGHKLTGYRDSAFGFALFDHTNREAEDQTERVLAEVERIKAQGEPPSFFWVHYFDVHEPYQETTFGTSDADRYDSEILHTDRELTRLLSELGKRLSRPLVLAISADHGEEFREHGGVYHGSTLFEEQVRVPLLFQSPGDQPVVVDEPVEVIDIAPTLLGMVGITPPASMRGRDLRVLAAGRPHALKPVFSAVLTKRMALRWPFKMIADLRFGLFELYDLSRDPHERRNLARDEPAQLAALQGDVYGWLDSLEAEPGQGGVASPEAEREKALRWGRLGDRRAVKPMAELLLDRGAAREQRLEAGRILARLADESAAPELVRGLTTEPPEVAAEAAIALGRMYDDRARTALERLIHAEDPYLRARAAVSLGRLRDVRAVPALIDALWVAPSLYEREEAVRWLGRLRDPSAVEPLIAVIPEFGLRYLVAVALGEIGDPRAFAALTDMLSWEERTNIRDEIVRGLGLLGDARATDVLVGRLASEPSLKQTAESLVRLSAPERGALGGRDVEPSLEGRGGLFDCVAGPLQHDWDYVGRTLCRARARSQLELPLSKAHPTLVQGGTLVLRLRRDDAAESEAVAFTLDELALPAATVDGNWAELRFDLPAELLRRPRLVLRLAAADADSVLAIDHALVVGKPAPLAVGASDVAEAADHAQRTP